MKMLLIGLMLCLTTIGFSQEKIIQSNANYSATYIKNGVPFNETSKIIVYLGTVFQNWNEDGSDGDWIVETVLTMESGHRLMRYEISLDISLTDIGNVVKPYHDYVRDEIYTKVNNFDPFGLANWTKLY